MITDLIFWVVMIAVFLAINVSAVCKLGWLALFASLPISLIVSLLLVFIGASWVNRP